MSTTTYKTDYFSLALTALFSVAISITGVAFLLNNGYLGSSSNQSDTKVIVLDTLAAVQAIPLGSPNYSSRVEQMMIAGRDLANDLAAQGYIVLDSEAVLRTPASRVVMPEIDNETK